MQSGVAFSRSTYRAVQDNSPESRFISTSTEEYHPQELSEPITPSSSNAQKEMSFHTQYSDSSCTRNNNEVDHSHQAISPLHCTSQLQSSYISHDLASWGNVSCEASNGKSSEIVETPRTPKDSEQSVHREGEGANNQLHAQTSIEWFSESTKPQSDREEEATNQNLLDGDCGWVSDYSHTPSGWDELQSNYQQQSESNQDWINDISRPRQEWEGLRQARYQEMLDPFIDNHDIRQLLNRYYNSLHLI